MSLSPVGVSEVLLSYLHETYLHEIFNYPPQKKKETQKKPTKNTDCMYLCKYWPDYVEQGW